MPVGDLIELEISEMVYGGNAFGRYQGRAVFVGYALPGDRVEARIVEDRGRLIIAETERVIQPSLSRRVPRCKHFGPGLCGGCQWQHVDYEAQLRFKQRIVHDQLTRFGDLKNVVVQEIIPSREPWQYRTHATLHIADDGRLGYVSTDDSTILPIEECHIIRSELMALLKTLTPEDIAALRHVRLQIGSSGELMVAASEDEDYPQFNVPAVANSYRSVQYTIRDRRFRVSGGSFFQVNPAQAEVLVDQVLRRLALKGDERVLDLYSGVGLFTAFIAPLAQAVTAVESAASSVADAAFNLAETDNVLLVEDTVERALPKLRERFDAVVVDPPRSGLGERAVRALREKRPRRIVYVSCDPSSLARDARALIAAGYAASDAQPVDMFPQTHHVETVMSFTLG